MNFSRIIFKYIPLFLLSSFIICKYSVAYSNTNIQIGNPLIVEIPRIPSPDRGNYTQLLVSSSNLLLISTDGAVYIYDGINYQNLIVPGKPILYKFNEGEVAICGENYLSALSQKSNGCFYNKVIINPQIDSSYGAIQPIGSSNSKLIISNNKKYWEFDGNKIISVDYSKILNRISTTRNKPISEIFDFPINKYLPNELIDIQTVDSVVFYAITSTQIFRFINPSLVTTINPAQFSKDNNLIYNKLLEFESKINKDLSPIGYSYSNEKIYLTNSVHYNFQRVCLKSKANEIKPLFALERLYRIKSVYLDSDSSLYISTPDNILVISKSFIDSQNQFRIYLNPYFSITAIKDHNKDIVYSSFINVSNDTLVEIDNGNSIEVKLSGLDNIFWNNLCYSVFLEGCDSTWSSYSPTKSYSYIGLKPKLYTLRVKIITPIGNESTEKTITIKVVPAFYQTKLAYILSLVLLLIALFTFIRWRRYYHALEKYELESLINKRTDELVKEKEKTENLLARVLPRETAKELKETGKVNTQRFKVVTVLFSDIQGFTRITDETNPEILIDQLDRFFLYFDSVVEKYKIEKIKTIGDAYMCAGGIPQKNRTNPVEVVLAALEMMNFMKQLNRQHKLGFDVWDLRIGIDTGPVIAGVVGRKKLAYDIWGSTVNTASRMESSGEIGKINISGNTYMLVKDYFHCTYRGKMPVKNKGDIEMYFVEGIKPEYSENFEGIKPNRELEIQIQMLRLGDLEELILDKLDKGLPKNLHYHNLKHTVDVYTQVELIGRSENVTKEELLLLRTAALFHDSGHMIDYDTHEEMGVKLAREILPEYQYSERQIEIISSLIMATKMPPRPKNLMEAIMCDADLDYLGRTDFIPVSNNLYKELHEHGKIGALHEWNDLQMKFIEKHQYFTNTARRLRNVNKNSQLENIKEWIIKNNL